MPLMIVISSIPRIFTILHDLLRRNRDGCAVYFQMSRHTHEMMWANVKNVQHAMSYTPTISSLHRNAEGIPQMQF